MRTLRLAQAAAQAEGLRLKRVAYRAVRRAIYLSIAGLFALSALVCLHVIIYLALRGWTVWSPIETVGTIFGGDLLLAIVFLLVGRGSLADPIEMEATAVRDASIAELRKAATMAALLGPVGRTGLRGLLGVLRRMFRRAKVSGRGARAEP